MKKILFSAVSAIVILSSCSNDDKEIPPTVIGTWKQTKTMYISGKDNSVLSSEPFDACESKSNFVFTTDNKLTYNKYYLSGNNCILENGEVITYSYDSNTKILILYNTHTTETYTLNLLTDNEMQIIESTSDYNDDGIDDKFIIVLNK